MFIFLTGNPRPSGRGGFTHACYQSPNLSNSPYDGCVQDHSRVVQQIYEKEFEKSVESALKWNSFPKIRYFFP